MTSGSELDRQPLAAVLSVRPLTHLDRDMQVRIRAAVGLSGRGGPRLDPGPAREVWWRADARPALAVLERARMAGAWSLVTLAAPDAASLPAVLEAIAGHADRVHRVLLADLGFASGELAEQHRSALIAYGFTPFTARRLLRAPR